MIRYVNLFAIVVAMMWSGTARAQSVSALLDQPAPQENEDKTDPPIFKIQFQASPAFGRNAIFQDGDTIVDDSAFDLGGQVAIGLSPRTKIKVDVGATSSPEMFDDDAPTSTLYGQLGVETRIPLRKDTSTGFVTPFLRYRRSSAYENVLDLHSYSDSSVVAGFTFEDGRTIACRDNRAKCAGTGLKFSLTADLAALMSDREDRERITPRVSGKVTISLTSKVDLFIKGKFEGRYFTSAKTPAGAALEDYVLDESIGFDFGKLIGLAKPGAIALSVEAALRQRWSNDATRDYNRVYFVPALTLSYGFGG